MATSNGDGTVTYHACNDHTMQYWEDGDNPGKPARGAAWEAWCAPNCAACREGYDLPDW